MTHNIQHCHIQEVMILLYDSVQSLGCVEEIGWQEKLVFGVGGTEDLCKTKALDAIVLVGRNLASGQWGGLQGHLAMD